MRHVALILLAVVFLAGCQDEPARPPAAAAEAALRAQPPPAAAEVAELAAKRHAAELAAAAARAQGDQLSAAYQERLAVELARLEAEATARARAQRAELDALADAAHARAVAEQVELDRRAERAAQAAALRQAWLVGAGASLVAVVLLVVCWRLGLPLWIPGAVEAGAVGYVGFQAAAPALTAGFQAVGWLVALGLIVAVAGGVAACLRHLWRLAQAAAAHGDGLESEVVAALRDPDPTRHAEGVRTAVLRAKVASRSRQVGERLHASIQRVRGKS